MPPTTLTQLSRELVELREAASPSIVQIHAGGQRPASGLAIGPDTYLVAGHTVDQDNPVVVRYAGQEAHGTVTGVDPGHGVGVVRAEGLSASRVAGSPRVPADGELGVVVYRNARALIRSGVVTVHSGATLSRQTYGGALASILHTDFAPVTGWSGGVMLGSDGSPAGLLNGGLVRGAGLVVPLDQALKAAADLEAHGSPKRGWLGIASQPVRLPERQRAGRAIEGGLMVLQVTPESPADKAGVLVGDVLVSFDATAVDDAESLLGLLSGNRVGRTVAVEVIRGAELRVLQVDVGERHARR